MIEELVFTSRRVKLEVRPLLLPHLVRVVSLLEPGLTSLNWTNPKWKEFYENTKEQIKEFDILITRVHDVYDNRYQFLFYCIHSIKLKNICFSTKYYN